ncbi:MAG: O-antigen ligase family protein [Alphaproteobacteria bacterium]
MTGRQFLFAGLCLLLVLSPLQYGGNRPWSMAAIQIAAAMLAAGIAITLVRDPKSYLPYFTPLRSALILAGLVVVWCLVQTVSWTPSGLHHPVWALAGEALTTRIDGAIAVRPDMAWFKAMLNLSYLVVFVAAFMVCLDNTAARRVLLLCILCPAAYGAYGLVLKTFGLVHSPLPPSLDHLNLNTEAFGLPGPFANSGHFAFYLIMGLTCAGALFVQRARRVRFEGRWQMRLGQGIEAVMGHGLPVLAVIFMLISAVVLGASRAGLLMLLGSVVLLGTAFWFKLSRRGRPVLAAGALVLVLPTLLLVLQLSGERVSEELSRTLTGEDFLALRFIVWEQSLRMIGDAPVLGAGLESFADLHPLYSEGGPARLHFHQAHNEYLDTAVALGLPATVLWFAALARIYGICLHGVLMRSRRLHYVLAPAVVMTLAALHGFVDFSLEIPANALLFSVLMGMGCAQAGDNAASRRRQGLE